MGQDWCGTNGHLSRSASGPLVITRNMNTGILTSQTKTHEQTDIGGPKVNDHFIPTRHENLVVFLD